MNYIPEATLNIIRGNPDRDSNDAQYSTVDKGNTARSNGYTTIDKMAANYVEIIDTQTEEGVGVADESANYFTLERNIKDGDNQANDQMNNRAFSYELAKPLNTTGHDLAKPQIKPEEEGKDYDHLEHMGLSQKVRQNDSNDTYAHAQTGGNDSSDMYAHAQRRQRGELNDNENAYTYAHAQNNGNEDSDTYDHSDRIRNGCSDYDYTHTQKWLKTKIFLQCLKWAASRKKGPYGNFGRLIIFLFSKWKLFQNKFENFS